MDARKLRGQQIAQTCRIVCDGGKWLVPSQSGNGRYAVRLFGPYPSCTCPDYDLWANKCKHIHAVEFTRATTRDNPDGTTTEETVTVRVERKTYPQDWPNYNAAQVNERRHFLTLLSGLCDTIPAPEQRPNPKGGRPALPLRDTIFAACLKVYSLMSARRFAGDLDDAHAAGCIATRPHFNSVLNVFDKEETTPILREMVVTSSLPLRAVETNFAVDSTGFATQKYLAWFDHKYGKERREARWVKAHFCTGVRTNVITAANVTGENAGDSPEFPELVHTTSMGFTIGEVSADKAYCARVNFDAVEYHGGRFFPAFRSNATGGVGGAFAKAFHLFELNREEYMARYHRRSNVESTVSMVKRKFGDGVKAKNDTAQKNEVYAKFVCHNICVLIAEMYALGINPTFCRHGGPSGSGPDGAVIPFPGA